MSKETEFQEILERHADTKEEPWTDNYEGRIRQEAWEDKQFLIDMLLDEK